MEASTASHWRHLSRAQRSVSQNQQGYLPVSRNPKFQVILGWGGGGGGGGHLGKMDPPDIVHAPA